LEADLAQIPVMHIQCPAEPFEVLSPSILEKARGKEKAKVCFQCPGLTSMKIEVDPEVEKKAVSQHIAVGLQRPGEPFKLWMLLQYWLQYHNPDHLGGQ